METELLNDEKLIVFQLNEEEYALSVNQVGAIERMIPITRVPQTAKYVKGVINLRGIVTPVIDLRLRFGMEATVKNESTRIIIVSFDNMEVGLIVDATNDIIDIPNDRIESTPEAIGSVHVDYIRGVAKVDDRLIVLLNLQKVLKIEENESLLSVEG